MSKFLKCIVNLVVICAILVAGALLVPTLAGIPNFIIDDVSMDTNLPVGSVTYGKEVKKDSLATGDKVVIRNGNQIYEYKITDMDATAGSYKGKDIRNSKAEEQALSLGNKVVKPVITIPFIAYAAIALKSTEGLIIIGLGVVFLIILFVLAELWKKNDGDDDDDEDGEGEDEEEDDDDEPVSRRQQKKEEKLAKKAAKKEEKRRRKEGLDEDDEEFLPSKTAINKTAEPDKIADVPGTPLLEEPMTASADDVMQEAMASIAEGVAQASEIPAEPETGHGAVLKQEADLVPPETKAAVSQQTVVMPDPKQVQKATQEARVEQDVQKLPPEKVRHTPSAQELIAKATTNGDEPDIDEDEETGVTLLDYSDLL